jgi:hypothetical protein
MFYTKEVIMEESRKDVFWDIVQTIILKELTEKEIEICRINIEEKLEKLN